MKTTKILLLLFLSFPFLQANAQLPKMEAAYIFNLARYFEWKADYRTGNFIIGVLGEDPVHGELKTNLAGKQILGQNVEIVLYKSVDAISKCHILFVTGNQNKNMAGAISKVGANCTLIMSDKPGSCEKGSALNFLLIGQRLQWELKKSNATKLGLKINSEIDKLTYKQL